jgi:hypothetical protein
MADKKISALPPASTPLAGTEVLPIVQGGITEQVSVANLTAGRAVSAAGLTSSANITLSTNGTYVQSVTSGGTGTRMLGINAGNTIYVGSIDTQAAGGVIFINGTQFMGVDTSSNVTVNVGNLKIGTAGKGIDFSAATHAAGMTSELLNDYEEGTWTPTGNNVTFASASGKYTKIGRQVTVTFDVTMPSTANADQCQLQGLPFTVGSGGGASIGYTTNSNVVTFLAGDTGTSLNGYLFGGSALANVTYSGARVVGSCTYFV